MLNNLACKLDDVNNRLYPSIYYVYKVIWPYLPSLFTPKGWICFSAWNQFVKAHVIKIEHLKHLKHFKCYMTTLEFTSETFHKEAFIHSYHVPTPSFLAPGSYLSVFCLYNFGFFECFI